MNFPDLVRAIAKDTSLPRCRVRIMLRSAFREIRGALGRGEDVSIYDFGRFSIREMADRVGRDFRTGDAVVARGKRKVRFTPGGRIERAIRRR